MPSGSVRSRSAHPLLGSTAGALDADRPSAAARSGRRWSAAPSAGRAVILLSARRSTRLAGGRDGRARAWSAACGSLFLALAAAVAGAGWALGDALPLIVALVMAGIDVVETSFLLLVVGGREPVGWG